MVKNCIDEEFLKILERKEIHIDGTQKHQFYLKMLPWTLFSFSASQTRGLQHESFLDSYFVCLSVLIPFLQDVSIESEYRRYSKATQQSLQVWNGEQIDLGLVGFLLCLPSLSHLLAPASVLIFHTSNACNKGCHKRMSLVL